MPMDPFFTSKGENPRKTEDFKHQRATAWAKAIQFRRFASQVHRKHAENAMKKHLAGVNNAQSCAKVGVHNQLQVLGGPSLTGFKQPKKKWKHRNSQHPKGEQQ